jgi:hypothetical protein
MTHSHSVCKPTLHWPEHLFMRVKVKLSLSLIKSHAMKMYGSGGLASSILNFSTGQK